MYELILNLPLALIWTLTGVHHNMCKDDHHGPMLHEWLNLSHESCFILQLREAEIDLSLNQRVIMVSKICFMLMPNICWAEP